LPSKSSCQPFGASPARVATANANVSSAHRKILRGDTLQRRREVQRGANVAWRCERGTGVPPAIVSGTGVPPVVVSGTGVPPVFVGGTGVPPVVVSGTGVPPVVVSGTGVPPVVPMRISIRLHGRDARATLSPVLRCRPCYAVAHAALTPGLR
jgi:hypothetical protein